MDQAVVEMVVVITEAHSQQLVVQTPAVVVVQLQVLTLVHKTEQLVVVVL